MRAFSRLSVRFASLEVNIAGLQMSNPLMPAAGPPVKDAKAMIECVDAGVGAIVAKTVSVEAAVVPRPCMIKTPTSMSMLNHELWSDLPYEEWLDVHYPEVQAYTDIPFIASAGYNQEEIRFLSQKLVEEGNADALELSIHYLGSDPQMMVDSIKAAKEGSGGKVPIFPKLSPNIPDIQHFALEAQNAGADGIVAINSVGPTLQIDIETGWPVTGGGMGYGWLSGEAIKPLALRCVYEIASVVDIPVIGVGGVSTGSDAIEFIMAGASGVQVCTSAIYKGAGIFEKILGEMEEFMDQHGYETIDDFRGLALKHLEERQDPYLIANVPQLDEELCIRCGKCSKQCIYHAIGWEKREFPTFDEELCYGCGLCTSFCPQRAITIEYWN